MVTRRAQALRIADLTATAAPSQDSAGAWDGEPIRSDSTDSGRERGLGTRLRDRRFWAVQAVVVVVTALHWGLKLALSQDERGPGGLYVVPLYSLYLLPVLYASLRFGRQGALPTAVWSTVLAAASILLEHRGGDAVVEAVQLLTMLGLGVLIADRVDREVAARRAAEEESRARRTSDAKYRRLFESAGDAVVVLDAAGRIQEANVPAAALFGRTLAALSGADIADVIGWHGHRARSRMLAADVPTSGELVLARLDGRTRVAYVCAPLEDGDAGRLFQAVFRGVAERHEQGIERCIRATVRLLVEERGIVRHVGRDCRRSLVLLRGRLDVLAAAAAAPGSDLGADLATGLRDARQLVGQLDDDLRRLERDPAPLPMDDPRLAPAVSHAPRVLEEGVGGRAAAAKDGEPGADQYARLTHREREVLRLVADGLTNAEIAARLGLSPNTVHRHRTSVMRKLGLHDRLAVLRFCIRRGVVDPLTLADRAEAPTETTRVRARLRA